MAEKTVQKAKMETKSKVSTPAKTSEKNEQKASSHVSKEIKQEHKVAAPKEQKNATAKTAQAKTEASPKKEKAEKKSRKVSVKKSKQVLKMRSLVLSQSGNPTFRGRFGNRSIKRKGNAKWDKWRVPRGIDIQFRNDDGATPNQGYRTPRFFRGVHPSGFREMKIKTLNELSGVSKDYALRIEAGIGKKKKLAIVDKAIEMGLKVLNP